jgi:hypothetical protein
MKNEKDIILKAWDTYQSLIAGLGESCWKIRSLFYTVSFGVIAAAFSSDLRGLYLLVPPLSILFCLLEAGYQQIQQQYIDKSTQIETAINDMIAKEAEVRLPDDGITTSLEPPSLRRFSVVFTTKKYLFWLSYLLVIVTSLVLFGLNVTKGRFAAPANPCPPVCCPCPAPAATVSPAVSAPQR